MTPAEFIDKWRQVELKERASAQEHFLDLWRQLELPTPVEVDPKEDSSTFEKRVSKAMGGRGFADVWKRGHFAWEYKGRGKGLNAEEVVVAADGLEWPLDEDDIFNRLLTLNIQRASEKCREDAAD